MVNKKSSFIFYRSFFEASKPLGKEQKAELFDAICEYALNQEETEREPIVNAMFALIKPQLDANNKRYENGKKGGRPITKKKPNNNQKETKSKPNVNVNVNVNANKERTLTPLEIIKKDLAWWQPFEMKNKKQIEDWEKMLLDFNDKIDIEGLEYDLKKLKARLNSYCRNWIQNQYKFSDKRDKPKEDKSGVFFNGVKIADKITRYV